MGSKKRTTPEEQKRIVQMYTVKEMSQAKIAEAVGLTPGGVALILHRHGIRSCDYGGLGGHRKYQLTDEQSKLIVQMYEGGSSCEKISGVVGIPWFVVNTRLKELGVQLRPGGFGRGAAHHGWAGGRVVRADGYIQVLVPEEDPFYCMAQCKVGKVRYALEHRLVVARHIGRPLKRSETVHHIDGNKQNNDIDNLQLRHGRHGKGSVFRCTDCGSHNVEAVDL